MDWDVMAIGLTTLDIVGAPIDVLPPEHETTLIGGIEVVPAGTAGGFALVAATLGLRTRLVTALGDDRSGRFVRMILNEHGIDTTLVPTLPGLPTSATILPVNSAGQRPTLHRLGASMLTEITEAAIAAAAQVRHVHWAAVGGVRIDTQARARLLQAARAAGASVTCDLIAPGSGARAELADILPLVDCFMPSLAEASAITGQNDPAEAAATFLAMGTRRCIVKLGARGALVATPDRQQIVPAFQVAVVDTSSCGDAFCAGYVAGLLRGWDTERCVRLAAATASLVAQGLGTLGKLESFDQASEVK